MDAIQNKKTCLVYRSQKDKRSNVWSYLLYQHHQHQQSLDYTRSCTSHCTIYIIILLNHWNICIHICLTLLLMSSPINQFLTSDYTIPLSSISPSIIHQSNIRVNTSYHTIYTIINKFHTSDIYIRLIILLIPFIPSSIIRQSNICVHTSAYTILIPFIPLIPSSNIHQSNIGIQFHTSILYHHHSISYVWYIYVWLYYL